MPKTSGTLTEAMYFILLALVRKPSHGYAIMKDVSEMSGGKIKLAPGTLYGATKTMLDRGWIKELSGYQGDRTRQYIITSSGRGMVEDEMYRMKNMLEIGQKIYGRRII